MQQLAPGFASWFGVFDSRTSSCACLGFANDRLAYELVHDVVSTTVERFVDWVFWIDAALESMRRDGGSCFDEGWLARCRFWRTRHEKLSSEEGKTG